MFLTLPPIQKLSQPMGFQNGSNPVWNHMVSLSLYKCRLVCSSFTNDEAPNIRSNLVCWVSKSHDSLIRWETELDPYDMVHMIWTIWYGPCRNFSSQKFAQNLNTLGKKIVKVACFMWSQVEGISIFLFWVHRQINCSKLITWYQTRKFSVFLLPHYGIFVFTWWVLKS